MLTPSYLLNATEPAEEIAEKLHGDILARIIERIKIRFERGDNYILTAVDKWQIETLQQAGFLLDDIQKEIASATGYMQTEIAEAMEDAGVKALEYDDAIYREAGLDPVPLVQSPYLIQLMQDTYEQTAGEWTNFTSISKRAVHDLFVETCDTAYLQAISGAISPAQAYLEALEKIVQGGVYVQYPGGRRDTIETATARAVRTGISQASGRIQIARMDEMNVDLVLVSSHLGARPEHYVWQGKVYSRNGGEKYPDFVESTGYGTVTGLCGANCRHNFSPYFEGMKNPFQEFDSEENQKQYELEQRQRTLERRIRDTKRQTMGWKTALDGENDPVRKAALEEKYRQKAALLQKQNKAYNDFCEETGQKKRSDRIAIAKWDRKQAAQARSAAKKYAVDHPDSVVPKPYKPGQKKNEEKQVIPQERIRRRREGYFERQKERQQPNFDQMSKDDLGKYISENISATFGDVSGVNLDFYRKAVKAVSTVETAYGKINNLKVSFGGIKGNAYAEYDPRTKTLFLKKKGSLSQFAKSIAKADERTLRKYGVKYNAVSTYEGIVLHELGHAVDHDGRWELSRKLGATDKILIKARSISFYARTNSMPGVPRASEATAENLSAYFMKDYEKIDKDVLSIIEDYMKKHNQR